MQKYGQWCVLVVWCLLCVTVSAASSNSKTKVASSMQDTLEKVSEVGTSPAKIVDPDDEDGSGIDDFDEDYNYDETESFSSGQGIDDQVLKSIAQVDADLVPDEKTLPPAGVNQHKPDDIHFVDEADDGLDSLTSGNKVSGDSSSKTDDSLYEYDNEEYDTDYDPQPGVSSSASPSTSTESPSSSGTTTTTTTSSFSNDLSDKSESAFQPMYIFLIIASALISFTVFMVVFYLCRRLVLQKRAKKSILFVVSSPNFRPNGPHPGEKSTPIVKNYQRVPTSTKEFLYQHHHQPQPQEASQVKPLLT